MQRFNIYCLMGIALAMSLMVNPAFGAQVVGTATIRAPAVILSNNSGSLTTFTLVVTSGDGYVAINGPSSVGNSTFDSAQAAVMYATQYLGLNYSNYNFTYTISDNNQSVSGPSAGAAMTMLAISALSGRRLRPDFTMTGTISSNGTIGVIGGVYDKADAAKLNGMEFIMVPAVPASSQENELYYLVQQNFGIPLVQVANISQAAYYAFNNVSVSGDETYYNFYTDYNPGALPYANLSCSNNCSVSAFSRLANFTLNTSQYEIDSITQPGFGNVTRQLSSVINESRQIASRGYFYAAADIGFLDYINAYYFASSDATRRGGLATLQNASAYCESLSAPQLTESNYEWVIAGELRQAWGSYTISSVVSAYSQNTSALDTDEVLDALYSGAEGIGWCKAASFMYGMASNMSGPTVFTGSGLSTLASARIARAAQFGQSLYYATAEEAYASRNYPLAIIDADYAYAIPASSNYANMSTAQLDAMAMSISVNSTYGVWSTQFAEESQFYIRESSTATNATTAHSYAFQAISSALLAQQISNDTYNIYKNLVQGAPSTTVVQLPSTAATTNVFSFTATSTIAMIWLVLGIILILDLIILIMLFTILSRMKGGGSRGQRRANR